MESQALSYSDTILRKSVEVPETLQIAWLSHNDHLTRTRMVSHVLQGWPPCEALEKALTETVEWAVIPSSTSSSPLTGPSHRPLDQLDKPAGTKRDHPPEPEGPPSNRARRSGATAGSTQATVTTLKGNRTLCKAYSDNRKCNKVRSGEQCTDGYHLCDRRLSSGRGCGGRHRRGECQES